MKIKLLLNLTLAALTFSSAAYARDLEYNDEEVKINVAPGEPTQVQFPGDVSGGYKNRQSSVSLDRKGNSLVVFAQDNISENGEAIIVQLTDGRSYSVRIRRATADNPRDDVVKLSDSRAAIVSSEEDEPAYREKNFEYAPPTQVSGLVREMMLVAEFGKANVTGYRQSDSYKGDTILNDGTLIATVDRVFEGPNLRGYVLDVKNLLDTTQKINPASFRIDGTRAISANSWEIAPRPLTAEQEISRRDSIKVYVVTRTH